MNIYIHYTMRDEITHQLPNPMVQTLRTENAWVISSHTLRGMWLLIHAGIKIIHVSKGAQIYGYNIAAFDQSN